MCSCEILSKLWGFFWVESEPVLAPALLMRSGPDSAAKEHDNGAENSRPVLKEFAHAPQPLREHLSLNWMLWIHSDFYTSTFELCLNMEAVKESSDVVTL